MEEIFIMNDDQRAILETVARFVEEEVAPRAAQLDANPDPAQSYSWEIVEKAHEVGIRTMTLSEKWGGLGTDSLTTAKVIAKSVERAGGIDLVLTATESTDGYTSVRGKAAGAAETGDPGPSEAGSPAG